MRILFANKYYFRKAGAEVVALDTAELLRAQGHEIAFFSMLHPRNLPSEFSKYFVSNVDYDRKGLGPAIQAASQLLYSREARVNIERLLQEHPMDLAHLHNIYHQLSPSILHALKKRGVPVVMTLHDYKVVCASYSMIADSKPCESCRGGRYYQCAVKACVKDSRAKSLLSTIEMYLHHKVLHIYDLVDVFISPSRFLITKVRDMGFKGRIEYLPNFLRADDYLPCYEPRERCICYVGRLSREKGIVTLLNAVKGLDVTLKIIGEGPIREQLESKTRAEGILNVSFLGYKSGDELLEEIRNCMFLVIPSEWYENNPRTVIEAYALGKPVIGARIGGIPELVRDGETGLTFEPFRAEDLREKISALIDDSGSIVRMGRNGRRLVEQELNPDKHYEGLVKIYSEAINIHRQRASKV